MGRGNIDLFVGYVKYLEDKTQHVFQDYVGSPSNDQDQYSIYLYQGWRHLQFIIEENKENTPYS